MFDRDLGLQQAHDNATFTDAAAALKQEYRHGSRVLKLRCRRAEQIGGEESDIFRLEVTGFPSMNWTWEGALAWRPKMLANNEESEMDTDDESTLWKGEILEVDEDKGHLYVSTGHASTRPCKGQFLVKPFEFLAQLYALYHDDQFRALHDHLTRALETAYEPKPEPLTPSHPLAKGIGLPAMQTFWRYQWTILWGPPGTGKTYHIGQQIANLFEANVERVLVLSTTNRATDAVALTIGRAIRDKEPKARLAERVIRVGSGADIQHYEKESLQDLLVGGEIHLRRQLSILLHERNHTHEPERRAAINQQISQIRKMIKNNTRQIIKNDDYRVVISTVFNAVRHLTDDELSTALTQGHSPFSTVIVDEAGLISRIAIAALSIWAATRFQQVGDPKQLAPISTMSRVLPSRQAIWLAESGLAFLDTKAVDRPDVHMLTEQHRMTPEVRAVISYYQYGDRLIDANSVRNRPFEFDELLRDQPKAIWYVLDEDASELHHIRAERGPGNRSWIRRRSVEILEKLFRTHQNLWSGNGLFITPFAAQARKIRKHLAEFDAANWTASTVHAQQGTEADYVIFDTVNATSTAWPYLEWRRLINVGLSRARHCLIVLTSRMEMQEPYMAELSERLAPRILRRRGSRWEWLEVPAEPFHLPSERLRGQEGLLGTQIEQRKAMRPILSAEQQRLCSYVMDGKPRLVRGVAGSGKTVVLAHWLAQVVTRLEQGQRLLVVYGNNALGSLIQKTIQNAWRDLKRKEALPWQQIEIIHIKKLLEPLLKQAGIQLWRYNRDSFNYDRMAEDYLCTVGTENIEPPYHAVFIDEAQDLGPNTLKLLGRLAEPQDSEKPDGRSVMIFYDNAQNIYGRGTPTWSELGLNMQGRSTVMKESFRSTRPITEFALNTLYRLQPPENDPDHKELIQRQLIEQNERNGRPWWQVRFNQVDGPQPVFKRFTDREAELKAVVAMILSLIQKEGVRPANIRVLCNGKPIRNKMQHRLQPMLARLEAKVEIQTSQTFTNLDDTVVISTPHSYKGYESEVVFIPAADGFVGGGNILASALYVAMTRARSLLYVTGTRSGDGEIGDQILNTLESTYDDLQSPPEVATASDQADEWADLIQRLGDEHHAWFEDLRNRVEINQEPIFDADDSIIAEPLFWFKHDGQMLACFGHEIPSRRVIFLLEDHHIQRVEPGGKLPFTASDHH